MNINTSFSILAQVCKTYLDETSVKAIAEIIREFRLVATNLPPNNEVLLQTFRNFLIQHARYQTRIQQLLDTITNTLEWKDAPPKLAEKALKELHEHPITQERLQIWVLTLPTLRTWIDAKALALYQAEYHEEPPEGFAELTAEILAATEVCMSGLFKLIQTHVASFREKHLALQIYLAKTAPPDPNIAIPQVDDEKACQTDHVPEITGVVFSPEEQNLVDLGTRIYGEAPRRDCKETVLAHLLDTLKDAEKTVRLFFDHYDLIQHPKIRFTQRVFQDVYGRPMSLPEFLFRFPEWQFLDTAQIQHVVVQSKVQHDRVFESLNEVYLGYTNQALALEEYHRDHMHADAFQTADYREQVMLQLVSGELRQGMYMDEVRALVVKLCMDALKRAPRKQDVEYISEKVRAEMLTLKSKSIYPLVLAVNEETTQFIGKIHACYQTVLLRDAEEEEIDGYLPYYRENLALDPSHRIEDELYESLEFHEVLKSRIIEEWKSVHKGQVPTNAQVFKLLAELIKSPKKKLTKGLVV